MNETDIQLKADQVLADVEELLAAAAALHQLNAGDLADVELRIGGKTTATELAEQVEGIVAEKASVLAHVRSGHVYCYACQSAACKHSVPMEADQVFAGYESTGTALWVELYSLLLNIGDPRTDLLFRKPPRVVSRHVSRRVLIEEQLVSFGKSSLTYRIWGQVVAGYLQLHKQRCAITVQLVETRDHRLHLQVIAPEDLLIALAEASTGGYSSLRRIHDALADARRQLETLERSWRNARGRDAKRKIRGRGDSLLRHLSHSIERKGRQTRRRTGHAELRSSQKRPIHKAGDDLRQAQPGDYFRDVVKDSCIVCGKAGRVHVFTRDGRHVTSFSLSGSDFEKRVNRRRYQPMDVEATKALKAAVGRMQEDDPEA